MNLHLLDIYHDLRKFAIPGPSKDRLFEAAMNDLHQAALRELDYQAAMRRLNSEEPDSADLIDTDGDGVPDYLDADPNDPNIQ